MTNAHKGRIDMGVGGIGMKKAYPVILTQGKKFVLAYIPDFDIFILPCSSGRVKSILI